MFGHFVRILVDLDLNNDLRYKVLVERKGCDFFIYLKYENLPEFCNNYNIIGHSLANCKRIGDESINDKGQHKRRGGKEDLEGDNCHQRKGKKKIYVQVNGRSNAVGGPSNEKENIIDLEDHQLWSMQQRKEWTKERVFQM